MSRTRDSELALWLRGLELRDGPVGEHLGDEDIAALIEAQEDSPIPDDVRAHLASCDDCRVELVESLRSLSLLGDEAAQPPPPAPELEARAAGTVVTPFGRRRWWPVPALSGLAASLLLAGFLSLLLPWDAPSSDPPVMRAVPADSRVELLQPRGQVPVSETIVFEWTAVPGASAYELIVADSAEGLDIVLRLTTQETRAELSGEQRARLEHGRQYHWLVSVERGATRVEQSLPAAFSLK